MELYRREFLIYRIRCGYIPITIDGKKLLVYHPKDKSLFRASEKYIEAYEQAIEEELFDDDDVYNFLLSAELWTEQNEKELNEIVPGHIEYWKIELYKNILRSNTRQTIRKYLETAKKEFSRLYNIRHSLDHITCVGYANYVKSMFLISECARYCGKKVNWNLFDLNKVMSLYHGEILDSDVLRVLARSQPWSGMWPVLKANGRIFDTNSLTIEQQTLISWSTMYDKIYESPDCPSEEIIEDDDVLDGWLLVQRRQREADKKKQEVENTVNKKIANADEIYMVAETFSDAQRIEMLNDVRANQIKKQRFAEIKNRGQVSEQQLSDVKRKRAMQLQQAYVNQIKGNK